jgi:D-alanyl-D-alanine carboxypeptidase (penicillin-binding protein 5/6)
MKRRGAAFILFSLAFSLVISILFSASTLQGTRLSDRALIIVSPTPSPSPTRIPVTPTPIPTLKPVLTVRDQLPQIAAKSAYMIDMDTGKALVDIHGEQTMPMASTTKIMTALIAIQTANPHQMITVSQDAYDRVHKEDGSSAGLEVGEKVSLQDLLYGMMLPSGNDAAISIAETLGGSREQFVARMNLFARRLGLFQTHFTNPDGLSQPEEDPHHYSSARDIVQLTRYALGIPMFARIVQTKEYHLEATETHESHDWVNTNPLLGFLSGIIGVKTGHTWASGWCLVFAVKINGHYLIGAILDSPTEDQRKLDALILLKWGLSLPMLPPKI